MTNAAPVKKLPLPGETFEVEGRPAFLIPPIAKANDATRPWVWYAPTLPPYPEKAEVWMLERFLQAGFAVAGIDVGESYGSPAGRALFTSLYEELTGKRGLAKKACLLARSRGALMLYNWAAEHAQCVAGIAGIYPVCDLRSYPGLAKACAAYGLTPQELETHLAEHNPIDRLESLARAGVPIFHIHGDGDALVPLETNSREVELRYRRLGGPVKLVVAAGQGHNMWPGFFQCQELVDFVIAEGRKANGIKG